MISEARYDDQGQMIVDITVSAAVPWNDAFEYEDGTRALAADWTALELIIRPDFDHPTRIRKLSTDADDPDASSVTAEIIVDDAAHASFSFALARSVVASFLRNPDGSAARYVHILRAVYPDADADSRELWRGAFIVEPGLIA